MKTINLRYCYPYYTGDVFVEVSDEVAEVMVQSVREMYNYDRRTRYHKVFYWIYVNTLDKKSRKIMLLF